jgi:hypothetical protein
MSHSIFLQALVEGGSENIPTSEVLACFSGFIYKKEDTFIDVEFGEDGSCKIFLDTTGTSVDGLMVSRPCAGEGLFRCLYCVMKLGNFVLFEPGANRFIVLREDVIGYLPEGMAESLGEARIAEDVESFLEAYFNP